MILIPNLTLNISDNGSAVPSTNIYGNNKTTYINTGSGNVFKLTWEAPSLDAGDTVNYYKLVIKRHDTVLNVYYDIFDKNIGLVNEFYVDSTLLPMPPLQYMLSIYLVAYGKQGSILTSNVINPYVCKGTGTYVKVSEGYMKRAAAFAKVSTAAKIEEPILLDSTGRKLISKDAEESGEPLKASEATRILSSATWNVMQEGYTKVDGAWKVNNIEYEVLVDESGEIIIDSNNEPIYIL